MVHLETLKKYQAWRRGEDECTMDEAGLTPAAITTAIDWAIAASGETDALRARVEQLQQKLSDESEMVSNYHDTNSALAAQVQQLQQGNGRLELMVLDQRHFVTMPTAAIPAFNEIFEEIEYQNSKWGEQHIRNQTTEGHLLVLRKELQEAEDGWMKNLTGRNSVESELVQVAAVAIQALINIKLRQRAKGE